MAALRQRLRRAAASPRPCPRIKRRRAGYNPPMRSPALPDPLPEIASAVRQAGGCAYAVGGYVRDLLLGQPSKDIDVEVHGIELEALRCLLARFGRVAEVGRAFGVLRLAKPNVDFSLPRRDSKVGPGHRGFDVEVDPQLGFAAAARRRDLTINSMGLNLLTGEVLDPHGGRGDLKSRTLRAVDAATFPEDPLRALRTAQFSARFEMRADAALTALCERLDLSEVSAERAFEEFRKLLLQGTRPSFGLAFLREAGLLRFFPQLAALVDVPQDPIWHPEGSVWRHTLMVIDEAAQLRRGDDDDLALMFGALCHDFGKPATTVTVAGRVRSPAHAEAGLAPTRAFLGKLRAPKALVERVSALVEHHLAPALFDGQGAGAKAYRRLSRKLRAAGATMELLARVARADHLGRTTAAALAREFPAGERFLERARALEVAAGAPRDIVSGRHLIARGLRPGPRFGELLRACREVQDEHGWNDADRIVDAVLSTRG